jgi:hypothetical protein
MLNDETEKKTHKNNLSQPGLTCKTHDPDHETRIT